MKVAVSFLIFLSTFITINSQSIDLRNPNQQYDYVIVTKSSFTQFFDDFVAHKKNIKSLNSVVVSVDDIYAEFPDVKYNNRGIREFISFAGKNWPEPKPKYFLLAGDIDAIPSFQVIGILQTDTVVTDFYYSVDIDSNEDSVDYYVGRIAARDHIELKNYLAKVIDYESTPIEDWNNDVLSVGLDNENSGGFYQAKAIELSNQLFGYMSVNNLLSPSELSSFELRNSILNGINIKGYSSVFFFGGNNSMQFGDPPVLDIGTINDIKTNYYPLLVFMGKQSFSSQLKTSLIDQALFNEKGAIAGLSPVGYLYVNSLALFNLKCGKYLYSGGALTIAEALHQTMYDRSIYPIDRKDLFGVFGDPTLSIKYDILADVEEDEIVNDFELYQNYPNPFNPTTQISFSLPERTFVELNIYDMLGRKITNLISAEMSAGKHNVEFDASSFSSGIYLYQIKAGIYNQVRKMIFIK